MNKKETLQDIVAEMKRNGIPVIDYYAKRIEAALAKSEQGCSPSKITKNEASPHVFADLFSGIPKWKSSSADGLEVPIGWDETGEPVMFRLGMNNCHALMGGATGSGKSNLLHVIVCSLCHKYSPEELQIRLLDMKDGVEAFRYVDPETKEAWLPHAKSISAGNSPDFAESFVDDILNEIRNRNSCFKRDGVASFSEWRRKTSKKMPRIFIVIDEFAQMFADPDLAKKVSSALQEILQLGRSCGIHVLLSTQDTNALTTTNAEVILSQTPLRFALPDASGVLASGNHAARTILKPQCILNESRGEDGMNRVFVHPFIDFFSKSPSDLDLFRKSIEVKTDGRIPQPLCEVVDGFDGEIFPRWGDIPDDI